MADEVPVCAEIRKLSKIPIVFLSSADDNMNIVMAMNMGADDFIAKPFDLQFLRREREIQNNPKPDEDAMNAVVDQSFFQRLLKRKRMHLKSVIRLNRGYFSTISMAEHSLPAFSSRSCF